MQWHYYYKEHPREKFKECAVCFIHVYNQSKSPRRVYEHDNIELRAVLNTVSLFFLTDDSGLLCDLYQTSRMGESDCTGIFIMEKNKLVSFLENIQNHIQLLNEI